MFGPSFGTRVSHYNPDEPRDDHGRWTTGGSSWRKNLLRDPSPIGRARTFLGHGLVGAFQQGLIRNIAYPTPAEGKRMSHLLAAWTMAACLDDQSFHEHFTDGLVQNPKTLRSLRDAVARAAKAQTIGQMIEASYPLTAAIKAIGGDCWPKTLRELEDRVDAVMPMVSRTGKPTASRANEDQPIDSERYGPSSLMQLASGYLGRAAGNPAKPNSEIKSPNNLEGLKRYLSESWDSLAQAPSDIVQMAHDLIKDPMAFLEAIGPSLAGLGIGIAPRIGNMYFETPLKARVTQEGLDTITRHLSRLNGGDYEGNLAMMDRLKARLGSKITGPDFNYYVHEIMESRLMDKGFDYYSAHDWVLAVAGISPYAVYARELVLQHPDWFGRPYRAYWGIK